MRLRPSPPLLVAAAVLALAGCIPPKLVAHALLHPDRVPPSPPPPLPHDDVDFVSDGLHVRGWLFHAAPPRRGTVVFLHGASNNRSAAGPVVAHLVPHGWDVLAYDLRAHGLSGGDASTYGYWERRDLTRALEALDIERAVVVGLSAGGAVALLAAARDDRRIAGVVAVGVFSDLASVARERMPWWAGDRGLARGLALAEREGRFRVADVSPVSEAPRVRVPVLLIHGEEDEWTSPEHSRRVYAALGCEKRLIIVPGARHTRELTGAVWPELEEWLDARAGGGAPPSIADDPRRQVRASAAPR
jgi:uncharacterized protein